MKRAVDAVLKYALVILKEDPIFVDEVLASRGVEDLRDAPIFDLLVIFRFADS